MNTEFPDIEQSLDKLSSKTTKLNPISRNKKAKKIVFLKNKLERLKKKKSKVKKIEAIKSIVTDHAVVRYLERALGYDIEEVKTQILSPTVKGAIEVGAASVTENGITYRIIDNKIVTVTIGDYHA